MSVLRRPLNEVVRGWLDLNGPLLGPVLYLFESARSYIEERKEAFDARFGTDTAAPVLRARPNAGGLLLRGDDGLRHLRDPEFPCIAGGHVRVRRHGVGQGAGAAGGVGVCVRQDRRHRTLIAFAPHRGREHQAIQPGGPAVHGTSSCIAWMSSNTTTARSRPCCSSSIPLGGRRCGTSLPTWRRPCAKILATPMLSTSTRSSRMCCRSSRVLRKVGEGGPPLRPWSRYVVYAASAAGGRSRAVGPSPKP